MGAAPGRGATRHFGLWLKEEGAVAISDLHLGFEAALAEQGVSIPRFQRREILERLPPLFGAVTPGKRVNPGGLKKKVSEKPSPGGGGVKQGPRRSPHG